MATVLLVMSICSFLLGTFAIFTNTTGVFIFVFIYKIIGLFSLLTPVIYWLYLLNILK